MRQPSFEPVVVSAGVDWLTATTCESASSLVLASYASGIMDHQERIGGVRKGWGMSGFTGFRCGEVEMGRRGDEMIVRLMSSTAQRSWRRIYELADTATRIDVQVTVDMGQDCQKFVWEYYKKATAMSAKQKDGPAVNVILGNDGGATVYCGARTSNRFGRVYAKGPQSKDARFENCLRFEVQYNSRMAKQVARSLAHTRSEAEWCIARSVRFFEERIGSVPIRTAKIINDSCSRKRTEIEGKLQWLRASVNSSVRLLCDRGFTLEVLDALGLPSGAGPRRVKDGELIRPDDE